MDILDTMEMDIRAEIWAKFHGLLVLYARDYEALSSGYHRENFPFATITKIILN